MNLTPDELVMAGSTLTDKAVSLGKLTMVPGISLDDQAFLATRVTEHLTLARKLADELDGRNIAGLNLTVKLLQDLNLSRGTLDWHEDRIFHIKLADLERLVAAARAA